MITSASRLTDAVSLETMTRRTAGRVTAVDWDALTPPEGRRLRELGLDVGVEVEVLHRATLGSGPVACRIGRMTVALRRHVARAIDVTPGIAD